MYKAADGIWHSADPLIHADVQVCQGARFADFSRDLHKPALPQHPCARLLSHLLHVSIQCDASLHGLAAMPHAKSVHLYKHSLIHSGCALMPASCAC